MQHILVAAFDGVLAKVLADVIARMNADIGDNLRAQVVTAVQNFKEFAPRELPQFERAFQFDPTHHHFGFVPGFGFMRLQAIHDAAESWM